MKVLLTGANGQLAQCIKDRFPINWTLIPKTSQELDISSFNEVLTQVNEIKPDVIINAAAYTAVDKAEDEKKLSVSVNSYGSANLASVAETIQCKLIHVSTDYVFDGSNTKPYKETDAVKPLGVYGASKLAGELLIQSIYSKAVILRTSWVFSEYGNNFAKTMLRLCKDRDELSVVGDQYGCPTYAGDIANAIIEIIKKDIESELLHYSGDLSTNWAEFAECIIKTAQDLEVLNKSILIKSIKSEDYPTKVTRPKYSVLDNSKINNLGIISSDWKNSLKHVVSEIILREK